MTEFSPVLRQALLRANPDYFAMADAAQLQYRLKLPTAADFVITQTLLKELFAIRVESEEDLTTALDHLSPEQYLIYNRTRLPLDGIGEDSFRFNTGEHNDRILSYETLSDYDVHDHHYQESARQRDDPQYVIRDYRARFRSVWARLFVDGEFHYAQLHSLAGYLYNTICAQSDEVIEKCIPHRYVDGPEHGRKTDRGYVYDKRVDAGGMEPQLEELKKRLWAYQFERWEQLAIEFDDAPRGAVYIRRYLEEGIEPNIDFVFSDQQVLRHIRFGHFVRDCRCRLGAESGLKECIDHESQRATEFIHRQLEDILAHFDLAVVRLRKRKTVVLSPDTKGLL